MYIAYNGTFCPSGSPILEKKERKLEITRVHCIPYKELTDIIVWYQTGQKVPTRETINRILGFLVNIN